MLAISARMVHVL